MGVELGHSNHPPGPWLSPLCPHPSCPSAPAGGCRACIVSWAAPESCSSVHSGCLFEQKQAIKPVQTQDNSRVETWFLPEEHCPAGKTQCAGCQPGHSSPTNVPRMPDGLSTPSPSTGNCFSYHPVSFNIS